jgi:flap endonuclease-1
MGIRYLNNFLKKNASASIKSVKLSDLSGKKIAIDISIYMYKFLHNNTLIENMYLMLSIFRSNNIIPVFIFDGKAPEEKRELLYQRNRMKSIAEEEYNKLNEMLQENKYMEDIERKEIMNNMNMLKRKFISIKRHDIEKVKKLIRFYGASYYDAPGEADTLCALLTIENKVWACLSEDMDMFVYGCPRVLRYLSLFNQSVVLYDLKKILTNLNMTQKEFRQICVLSGTDYNCDYSENNTIYTSIKYFKEYRESKTGLDFYDWLRNNKDDKDNDLLQKIYNMFDLKSNLNVEKIKIVKMVKIANSPINQKEVEQILKEDGFIFPHKNGL